jgi:kynurenine formamidase
MSISEMLKKYEVVDLSHILEAGMPRPQVPYGHIIWKSYQRGDSYNTFMILVFEHAGTHVDAPNHLGGVVGPSISEVPLHRWMGECCVLDMRRKKEGSLVSVTDIKEWEAIHGNIDEGDIVLFYFGWTNRWKVPSGVEDQPYLRDFPGLSEEAAVHLAERMVQLVGTDTPSIDAYTDPEEHAHKVLLPKHILILENAMNLDRLPPKGAFLMAFPLKIGEGTGSPVRAVAFVPR